MTNYNDNTNPLVAHASKEATRLVEEFYEEEEWGRNELQSLIATALIDAARTAETAQARRIASLEAHIRRLITVAAVHASERSDEDAGALMDAALRKMLTEPLPTWASYDETVEIPSNLALWPEATPEEKPTPAPEAKPLTEDEAVFGVNAWVYCSQHMKVHQTGWCSVSARDKVGLGVATVHEGLDKCRELGLALHADRAKP